MDAWTMTVITRIVVSMVAIGLLMYLCYCIGKSKAEIFPDDEEDIEASLEEAHEKGYDEGYTAALQQVIKKYSEERMYTNEEK